MQLSYRCVRKSPKRVKHERLKHSYSIVERAYKIKVAAESMNKFPDCDLVINPQELINFGTFGMNNIDAIFNLGYTSTKKALEESKSVFKDLL